MFKYKRKYIELFGTIELRKMYHLEKIKQYEKEAYSSKSNIVIANALSLVREHKEIFNELENITKNA